MSKMKSAPKVQFNAFQIRLPVLAVRFALHQMTEDFRKERIMKALKEAGKL
jgi:hypothetical protein